MKIDELDELLRETARRAYNPPPPTPSEAIWAGIEAVRAARRGQPLAGGDKAIEPTPTRRMPVTRLPWWGLGIAAALALGIGLGRVMERSGVRGEATTSSAPSMAVEAPGAGATLAEGAPGGGGDNAGVDTEEVATGTGTTASPGALAAAGSRPASGVRSGARDPRAEARPPATPGAIQGGDAPSSPPRGPGEAISSTFRLAALEHLVRTEVLLTSFQVDSRAGRLDTGLELWARELLSTTRLLLDSPAAAEPRLEGLLRDLELVLAQIAQYPEGRTQGELELIDQALLDNDVITRLRLAVPSGPLLVRS
jgi:hypothetical protein